MLMGQKERSLLNHELYQSPFCLVQKTLRHSISTAPWSPPHTVPGSPRGRRLSRSWIGLKKSAGEAGRGNASQQLGLGRCPTCFHVNLGVAVAIGSQHELRFNGTLDRQTKPSPETGALGVGVAVVAWVKYKHGGAKPASHSANGIFQHKPVWSAGCNNPEAVTDN